MTIPEIVALIVALTGSIGALIMSAVTLMQKARESARNTEVMEAANVIGGYKEFCDDLRDRIRQLVEQIKGYEAELQELCEVQKRDREAFEADRSRLLEEHTRDRERWESDRKDLLCRVAARDKRIAELEQITAMLQATVNGLVERLKKYEKTEA